MEIDVAGRRIVVNPPDGLLELNAPAGRREDRHRHHLSEDGARTARGRHRRARDWEGLLEVVVHDLRDFTTDRHRVVDDVPFGGGPGMVLKPEPLFRAVDVIRERAGQPDAIVLTSPDGRRLRMPTQSG